MNRFTSIILALVLYGMIVPSTYLETPEGISSHFILGQVLNIALFFSFLFYCGFAAIHAVQHIENPKDRAAWMILTLGLNALGSAYYYCTKYQEFRKQGKGGWITK